MAVELLLEAEEEFVNAVLSTAPGSSTLQVQLAESQTVMLAKVNQLGATMLIAPASNSFTTGRRRLLDLTYFVDYVLQARFGVVDLFQQTQRDIKGLLLALSSAGLAVQSLGCPPLALVLGAISAVEVAVALMAVKADIDQFGKTYICKTADSDNAPGTNNRRRLLQYSLPAVPSFVSGAGATAENPFPQRAECGDNQRVSGVNYFPVETLSLDASAALAFPVEVAAMPAVLNPIFMAMQSLETVASTLASRFGLTAWRGPRPVQERLIVTAWTWLCPTRRQNHHLRLRPGRCGAAEQRLC